ncbi:MAG: hypothetical protein LBJ69_02560, partial [Holosporales bacterium]|nr:hypothetical protein [Holosporales bacterium]
MNKYITRCLMAIAITAPAGYATGHRTLSLAEEKGPSVYGLQRPQQIPSQYPGATESIDRLQGLADEICIKNPVLARYWIHEVMHALQRYNLTSMGYLLEQMTGVAGAGPNNLLMVAITAHVPETKDPGQDVKTERVERTLQSLMDQDTGTKFTLDDKGSHNVDKLVKACYDCMTIAGRAKSRARAGEPVYALSAERGLLGETIIDIAEIEDTANPHSIWHGGDATAEDPENPGQRVRVSRDPTGENPRNPTTTADMLHVTLRGVKQVATNQQQAAVEAFNRPKKLAAAGVIYRRCVPGAFARIAEYAIGTGRASGEDTIRKYGEMPMLQMAHRNTGNTLEDESGAVGGESDFLCSRRNPTVALARSILTTAYTTRASEIQQVSGSTPYKDIIKDLMQGAGTDPERLIDLAVIRMISETPGAGTDTGTLKARPEQWRGKALREKAASAADRVVPVEKSPSRMPIQEAMSNIQHIQYGGEALDMAKAVQASEIARAEGRPPIPSVTRAYKQLARYLAEVHGLTINDRQTWYKVALAHLRAEGVITTEQETELTDRYIQYDTYESITMLKKLPYGRGAVPPGPTMEQVEAAERDATVAEALEWAHRREQMRKNPSRAAPPRPAPLAMTPPGSIPVSPSAVSVTPAPSQRPPAAGGEDRFTARVWTPGRRQMGLDHVLDAFSRAVQD